MVEQLIRNEQVVGSSPMRGSETPMKFTKTLEINAFQAFFDISQSMKHSILFYKPFFATITKDVHDWGYMRMLSSAIR